jgi:hypothetical protein
MANVFPPNKDVHETFDLKVRQSLNQMMTVNYVPNCIDHHDRVPNMVAFLQKKKFKEIQMLLWRIWIGKRRVESLLWVLANDVSLFSNWFWMSGYVFFLKKKTSCTPSCNVFKNESWALTTYSYLCTLNHCSPSPALDATEHHGLQSVDRSAWSDSW